MASTHGDHTVRVSDVATGKCLHILRGHPRTPWCIAFHPTSNQILASGCLGGEVRIWDLHVRNQGSSFIFLSFYFIMEKYFNLFHPDWLYVSSSIARVLEQRSGGQRTILRLRPWPFTPQIMCWCSQWPIICTSGIGANPSHSLFVKQVTSMKKSGMFMTPFSLSPTWNNFLFPQYIKVCYYLYDIHVSLNGWRKINLKNCIADG